MADTKFSDLTASELGYLAGFGSEGAWEALVARGKRGDIEAVQYLNTGAVGDEIIMGEDGYELLGDVDEGYFFENPEINYGPDDAISNDEISGCASGGCAAANPYPYFVGADEAAPPPSMPLNVLMPHTLLNAAINQAASRLAPQPARTVPPPRPIARPMARPVARRPALPMWGVFIDFQDQPAETFATLKQANEWAKSVDAAGVPAFVVHANDEPPRAPFGYESRLNQQGEMPYGSGMIPYGSGASAQNIQSGTRQPSAYELYQLSQGQRI